MNDKIKEWDQYFGTHCSLPAAAIRDLLEALEAKDRRIAELEAEKYVIVSGDSLRQDNEALKADNERLRAELEGDIQVLKLQRDATHVSRCPRCTEEGQS
jgi:hypothetical protein